MIQLSNSREKREKALSEIAAKFKIGSDCCVLRKRYTKSSYKWEAFLRVLLVEEAGVLLESARGQTGRDWRKLPALIDCERRRRETRITPPFAVSRRGTNRAASGTWLGASVRDE